MTSEKVVNHIEIKVHKDIGCANKQKKNAKKTNGGSACGSGWWKKSEASECLEHYL